MSRQFIVSSLSLCLILHTTSVASEISQLLVDQDNHTIRFARDYGHGLFLAVVDAMVVTCNMSVVNLPAKAVLDEDTYWYDENWVDNTKSWLNFFRERDPVDDQSLERTLNCTATVANQLLYKERPRRNLFDSFNWMIPVAAISGIFFLATVIYKINGVFTQTQLSPV